MGCGCNKGGGATKDSNTAVKPESSNNILKNLAEAAKTQPDKIAWIKTGLRGILKCLKQDNIEDEDHIIDNRNKCRECEDSSKTNGKLTATSQCMAIDPATGKACGCVILCKTSVINEKCPLEKWTNVNITISKPPKLT